MNGSHNSYSPLTPTPRNHISRHGCCQGQSLLELLTKEPICCSRKHMFWQRFRPKAPNQKQEHVKRTGARNNRGSPENRPPIHSRPTWRKDGLQGCLREQVFICGSSYHTNILNAFILQQYSRLSKELIREDFISKAKSKGSVLGGFAFRLGAVGRIQALGKPTCEGKLYFHF